MKNKMKGLKITINIAITIIANITKIKSGTRPQNTPTTKTFFGRA